MVIEIYSKDNCPYCMKAKTAIKNAGHTYTEYKIGVNATKADVQSRINALGLHIVVSTVPQIFIDDEYVGGYDDLKRLYPDWTA